MQYMFIIIISFCFLACTEGNYGKDCKESCGKCSDGEICDPVMGCCNPSYGFCGRACKFYNIYLKLLVKTLFRC